MNSLLAWSRRNSNLNLSFVPPDTLSGRQRAVAARLDNSACVRCLSDPDAASPTLILSLTGRGGSHAIMVPPTAPHRMLPWDPLGTQRPGCWARGVPAPTPACAARLTHAWIAMVRDMNINAPRLKRFSSRCWPMACCWNFPPLLTQPWSLTGDKQCSEPALAGGRAWHPTCALQPLARFCRERGWLAGRWRLRRASGAPAD